MQTVKLLSIVMVLALVMSIGFVNTRNHFVNIELMEDKLDCYEINGKWNNRIGECTLSMFNGLEKL